MDTEIDSGKVVLWGVHWLFLRCNSVFVWCGDLAYVGWCVTEQHQHRAHSVIADSPVVAANAVHTPDGELLVGANHG